MRRIIIFSIVISLNLSTLIFAQNSEEDFKKANLAYENEDYEKAVSLYEMILEMDKVSPEVFYNLGNSYFKLKKIGKAIVNYERALRLSPRDRDIKLNLKLARTMMVDKIEKPKRGFVIDMILFLYDRMNINELTILCSILYLAVIALLIFFIFSVEKKRTIFYTVGVAVVMLGIFSIFLASKIHAQLFVKEAVVIKDKVEVRSGPKEDYLVQFTLHEGTELRVVKGTRDWYEIDLSKDLRGWIPKDTVEVI